jgi:uncharacterized protein YukE
LQFDMGDQTLSTLADQTQGAGDELRDLVGKLVSAADPLGRTFQGQARRTFDDFKRDADQVAGDLDNALTRILGGVRDLDTAFGEGVGEMAAETQRQRNAADIDQARFR